MTDLSAVQRRDPPTRWLTVEQLLAILPIKKSRLYYLTHTHQIPGVTRIGRTLLFDYDASARTMSRR